MKNELLFGFTALVRVESFEYRGQDIVPVVIARKSPIQRLQEYSRDGMFTDGDVIV